MPRYVFFVIANLKLYLNQMQARQETAVGNYVLPITTQILTASVTAYATATAQRYFAQITPGDTVNQTAVQLLSQAPQTISPAISWTMVNLRPYT